MGRRTESDSGSQPGVGLGRPLSPPPCHPLQGEKMSLTCTPCTTRAMGEPAPTERSTGNDAHDAAIKEGGGIPGGVMDLGEFGRIYNYHDPKTGSTLGFKEGQAITPETVKAQIQKSREAFGLK